MKLRDTPVIVPPKVFPINPEIVRARAVTAEFQLNRARAVTAELQLKIKKAYELVHTASNLITVSRLMREEIHWRKHRSLTNH